MLHLDGKKLRQVRESRELTQAQLLQLLDLSDYETTLEKLEQEEARVRDPIEEWQRINVLATLLE